MWNLKGITFWWTITYRRIFKSVLVYLQLTNINKTKWFFRSCYNLCRWISLNSTSLLFSHFQSILSRGTVKRFVVGVIEFRSMIAITPGNHSFSTCARLAKKLRFFTPWYAQKSLRIRGKEMLVLRKILRPF